MTSMTITSAPNIIPVLTDEKGFWIQVILAAITLLAVVVALFQEKIKDWLNQSLLDMKINLTPPDCHQIMLTGQFVRDNQIMTLPIGNAIYIRILVENINNRPGENVEVMVSKFNAVKKNGSVVPVGHFLPMNLKWSHFQPSTHLTRIPSALFRHCDFGHFVQEGKGGCLLKLDTIVEPNMVARGERPNIVKPGKYEFELRISGDNVKAITKVFTLGFYDFWSEDEKEMLRQIKITEKRQNNNSFTKRLLGGELGLK
ncbi:MAG: hypothetical protein WCT32_00045 [Patescibacteria group bacterium]|jgi:hypothetical protein